MNNVNIFVIDHDRPKGRQVCRSIGPIPNDDRALAKLKEIETEYSKGSLYCACRFTVVMRYAKQA
jgi:hypothetical protein